MKISNKMNKMKKLFVTILATTLSIVMFMTSASAADYVSYIEHFEHEGVVEAYESISWHKNRNMFLFAVDLECYECDGVKDVFASLKWRILSPSSEATDFEFDAGSFTPENTWDSDELQFYITNFACGYEIYAEIKYNIAYDNGISEEYLYGYTINSLDDTLYYERDFYYHIIILPEE